MWGSASHKLINGYTRLSSVADDLKPACVQCGLENGEVVRLKEDVPSAVDGRLQFLREGLRRLYEFIS
jgi:hypothetical protein